VKGEPVNEHEKDADFRELRDAVARLPKSIEPPRDLWPEIERSLSARHDDGDDPGHHAP
jgi:hypothetical protein